MDWFMGKGRRKDKDSPTPPTPEESRQYLQEDFVRERVIDADFNKLVILPPHLDYNEWLASHTISFFNHINLMYGVISEYCTACGCSSMTGPGNLQYLWLDEKGKKNKCAAPQYVDYVMSFIQKTINEESIFPTKYGNLFPSTFETTVKKIHRYLFHVFAHLYHIHYRELILLGIHGHLNSLFQHFMTFNVKFNLLEGKETEVLQDLMKALTKPMPDKNQNEESPAQTDEVVSTETGTDMVAPPPGESEKIAQEAASS